MRPLYVDEWETPSRLELRDWRIQAGPMATAFEMTQARCAMIVGPTGGGKSTVAARRPLRIATWQHPSPRDGVRKARICVVCPTYRRAWDQIMPSYFKVMPQGLKCADGSGGFRGSRGDPADHIYDLPLKLGGHDHKLHVEVLFRAVGDGQSIEDFVRGFETTAWHDPEADTNKDGNLLSKQLNRVGRYPEPEDRPVLMPADPSQYWAWHGEQPPEAEAMGRLLGQMEAAEQAGDAALAELRRDVDRHMPAGWAIASETYAGVFGDANAPVIGTWFHKMFYVEKRPLLFKQPPGDSVNAENLAQLRKISPGYYAKQKAELDEHDYRRLIQCKPGYGRAGNLVHKNFDEETHVARQVIEPDPNLPVMIGGDSGSNTLKPGAAFLQRGYSGQIRVLDEIYLPGLQQMSIEEFCARARQIMETRFRACTAGATWGLDPAVLGKNAMTGVTTAALIQHFSGIEVLVAPSQRPEHRRGAVDRKHLHGVGPGEPGIVYSPNCVGIIQGMSGGFHYPIHNGQPATAPAKNEFSHPCEGLEYGVLTAEGMDSQSGAFIRPMGEGSQDTPKQIFGD